VSPNSLISLGYPALLRPFAERKGSLFFLAHVFFPGVLIFSSLDFTILASLKVLSVISVGRPDDPVDCLLQDVGHDFKLVGNAVW